MTNYYCLFDTQLNLANLPFPARDDAAAVSMVRNMLLSSSDDVFKRVAPVCDLRQCGTFDEKFGCFLEGFETRLVCPVSDIPLPESKGGVT